MSIRLHNICAIDLQFQFQGFTDNFEIKITSRGILSSYSMTGIGQSINHRLAARKWIWLVDYTVGTNNNKQYGLPPFISIRIIKTHLGYIWWKNKSARPLISNTHFIVMTSLFLLYSISHVCRKKCLRPLLHYPLCCFDKRTRLQTTDSNLKNQLQSVYTFLENQYAWLISKVQ